MVHNAMTPTRLTSVKGRDEKRWKIEDAARVFKRAAEIKREIKEIKADKELFKATKELLAQEAADIKKAQHLS